MRVANSVEESLSDKVDGGCRGTFVGQKYGPFNDIPAVWDQFFGTKGYKALAAGIAGALSLFCLVTSNLAAPSATQTLHRAILKLSLEHCWAHNYIQMIHCVAQFILLSHSKAATSLQLHLNLLCAWDLAVAHQPCSFMVTGDGVEHLLWRLKNGELPPIVPPKAIIIACGTNSKGLVSTCLPNSQGVFQT